MIENATYAKIHCTSSVLHENSFFAKQQEEEEACRTQFVNTFAHFLIALCAKRGIGFFSPKMINYSFDVNDNFSF